VLNAAFVSRQIRTKRTHSHGRILANADGKDRKQYLIVHVGEQESICIIFKGLACIHLLVYGRILLLSDANLKASVNRKAAGLRTTLTMLTWLEVCRSIVKRELLPSRNRPVSHDHEDPSIHANTTLNQLSITVARMV
jgi:hypothetical protein